MEMFLAPLPVAYIFLKLFVLQESVLMLMTSTTETYLNVKLLKQGYRYHKIRKPFSKFYHRHSELFVKHIIGLKNLLQQGISEPIFYGDLVYKFKRIVKKITLVINSKRLSNVTYWLDITWMSCDSLHAWV